MQYEKNGMWPNVCLPDSLITPFRWGGGGVGIDISALTALYKNKLLGPLKLYMWKKRALILSHHWMFSVHIVGHVTRAFLRPASAVLHLATNLFHHLRALIVSKHCNLVQCNAMRISQMMPHGKLNKKWTYPSIPLQLWGQQWCNCNESGRHHLLTCAI